MSVRGETVYTIKDETADVISKDVLEWHFNALVKETETILNEGQDEYGLVTLLDIENNIKYIRAIAIVLQYFGVDKQVPEFGVKK